ncbi:hypothetical protein Pfo_029774 [Paulownia fortunei]|nr:hypothetical protein Pfo_029774 [Paulownia fortunei]
MANRNNIDVLVYFGGQIIQDANSVTYDRPTIGARRMSRRTRFSELLLKVYQITGVNDKQFLLKLFDKYCCSNVSQLISITDDEGLEFFLDPGRENQFVEFYVEAEQIIHNIVPEIPTTNEYYQYVSFLRDDSVFEMTTVTQGMASVVINEFNAGASSVGQEHFQGTNTEPYNAYTDELSDPLADSLGAEEHINSEPDEIADEDDDGDDDGDGVEIDDLEEMYEQHDEGNSSQHQVPVYTSLPSTTNEYDSNRTIPFFTTCYPEIVVDSIDIPNKEKFYDSSIGELEKGMVFKDKKNLQASVKDYSVRVVRREYRVVESTPKLWKVECSHSTSTTWCNWGLRASLKAKLGLWKITKWAGPHTCLMNSVSVDHRNLCKNMIARLLTGIVQCDTAYEIKYVQQNMKEKYQKYLWHLGEPVRKLPNYLEALQKLNPGTIVEWHHIDTEFAEKKILKYVFWAFKSCIDGFQNYRKVISVDGTHLYTKYKHKLLIAVGIDANQQVLPLAFAVVDEETFTSWRWFLHMLSMYVVRGIEGVCLISDRHSGLLEVIQYIPDFTPPRGVHRFCLRHVSSNFNKRFKSIALRDLCYTAGSQLTIRQFDKVMEKIKALNDDAHTYLENIDKCQWTLAYDGGWRCGILTTNMSECINGMLKGARWLPVTAIIQITFHRAIKYFLDRSTIQGSYDSWQNLSIEHMVHVFNYTDQSASVITRRSGSSRSFTHVVKLRSMECSCGNWSQFGIPCSHAMHTCRHFGVNPATLMKSYCSTASYVDTYKAKFEPLPDEVYWDAPHFELWHNPALRIQNRRGRNTTTRIPNEMDWPQTSARQQARARQRVNAIERGTASSSQHR